VEKKHDALMYLPTYSSAAGMNQPLPAAHGECASLYVPLSQHQNLFFCP
jgi:hypothetical protein